MWIKDDEFIRGNIPMSKFEVRTLILANMDISKGDRFLDIGAGTGSVSIQAAKLGAEVSSIEREKEGIELIKKNADKFKVRIDPIEGYAPEAIPNQKFNKIFIGGSGGNMAEIVEKSYEILEKDGVIAASFITLKNLDIFKEKLKELGFINIETALIQVSRVKTKAEMMIAENPIFIVKGEKNE